MEYDSHSVKMDLKNGGITCIKIHQFYALNESASSYVTSAFTPDGKFTLEIRMELPIGITNFWTDSGILADIYVVSRRILRNFDTRAGLVLHETSTCARSLVLLKFKIPNWLPSLPTLSNFKIHLKITRSTTYLIYLPSLKDKRYLDVPVSPSFQEITSIVLPVAIIPEAREGKGRKSLCRRERSCLDKLPLPSCIAWYAPLGLSLSLSRARVAGPRGG